jgi:hypothetical protein
MFVLCEEQESTGFALLFENFTSFLELGTQQLIQSETQVSEFLTGSRHFSEDG